MRSDILEKVSGDLLSIPPLIFRSTRRKIVKTTLSDMNITHRHFEIMILLEEKGTLHVCEIGDKLQIAKAQMTKLIDRLVAMNLVERATGITDRRTFNVTLTEQARAILKEHKNSLMRTIQETMSRLTDEELESLSVSLRNLQTMLLKAQQLNS
jgi:MarR family 2-MHQ and catechol resistance regulon transcriptional repressor